MHAANFGGILDDKTRLLMVIDRGLNLLDDPGSRRITLFRRRSRALRGLETRDRSRCVASFRHRVTAAELSIPHHPRPRYGLALAREMPGCEFMKDEFHSK
jgi:hypothetical protein